MRGPGRLLALPIIVLGLLLQINAPAQATASARTTTALETMICADVAGRQTAPAKHHHDGMPCTQCAVCGITPAAVLGDGVAIPAPAARAMDRTAEVAVVGPRGPPAFAPKARGPPLTA